MLHSYRALFPRPEGKGFTAHQITLYEDGRITEEVCMANVGEKSTTFISEPRPI